MVHQLRSRPIRSSHRFPPVPYYLSRSSSFFLPSTINGFVLRQSIHFTDRWISRFRTRRRILCHGSNILRIFPIRRSTIDDLRIHEVRHFTLPRVTSIPEMLLVRRIRTD